MIDRIFSLTLTFAVLVGSSLALASDFISSGAAVGPAAQAPQVSAAAVLPRVVITGHVERSRNLAQASSESERFVQ